MRRSGVQTKAPHACHRTSNKGRTGGTAHRFIPDGQEDAAVAGSIVDVVVCRRDLRQLRRGDGDLQPARSCGLGQIGRGLLLGLSRKVVAAEQPQGDVGE
jgi:hypothetical protein